MSGSLLLLLLLGWLPQEPPKPEPPEAAAEPKAEEKKEKEEEKEAAEESPYLAVVGGDVYTVSEEVIVGSTVLVKKERILKVGRNLHLPEGARVIDAAGMRVYPGLIAVNGFLREFGTAMTLSPSQNLSVAVRRYPATLGVDALSRPGEPLGVWCLQGAPLAEMAGTPVAMARTFGQGRMIAMDAGFAVDPVEPPADRKKAQAAYGIQLEQNREFVARCVAWLLAED